jgi:hypothetical protein
MNYKQVYLNLISQRPSLGVLCHNIRFVGGGGCSNVLRSLESADLGYQYILRFLPTSSNAHPCHDEEVFTF